MAKIVNVVYHVNDRALQKAKLEIQGIEKETKDSEKEMAKLDKTIQKVGNDGGKSFLNFRNVLAGFSVATIIAGFTQLGRKIYDLGVQQEQLNIAFSTFLGSATKAKQVIADLTKFSIVTPFTPDQVNKAAKTLLAFGLQSEELIPTLKMLGDVSSGTGKDLSEMAVIFGQIRSTGRLMGQDLLQLINAGFNPLQVISEKTGKSVAVLKKEMEDGAVSFQMVSDAFKTATSEGGLFFNLMEKQSQSIGGIVSTITGNIEEGFKNIFTASSGPLRDFVLQLQTLSEAFLQFTKTKEQIVDEREIELINDATKAYDLHFKVFKDSEKARERVIELIESQKASLTEQQREQAKIINSEITLADILSGKQADIEREKEVAEDKKAMLGEEWRMYDSLVIPALDEYILKSSVAAETTKAEGEEHKKNTENVKNRAKALEKLNEQLGFTTASEKVKQKEADAEEIERIEREANERSNTNADRQREYEKQKTQEALEERWEMLEADAERRQELEEMVKEFAIDTIQQVLYASLLAQEEDFSAEQNYFDRQQILAGDNERRKGEVRAREEEAEKAFRERQRKAERENALKKIAIDTAINVVRSITNNGGIPYGLPAGALALATGLAQAALVRKYKKGEVNIDGPGTSTSDSIPAMLSKGESVINADATSKSTRLLEAINDRRIDDRVLHNIAASGGRQINPFDDSRIVEAINKNKMDFGVHGYTIMKGIQTGKNFKQYMRSKYQGYK